jgi:hypothetical protein
MPQAMPYSGAQCIDGYTVLSYNDLILFENQLPSPNFFNVPTWINAMAESFNIYCLIISKTNIYISQMV